MIVTVLFDLFKIFVLWSILRSPLLVPLVSAAVTLLLLLMGIFIRFKNGWFSVIAYTLLLSALAGYAFTSCYVIFNPPEDLKLGRAHTVKIVQFTEEGAVLDDRRNRRQTLPLLGVSFPSEQSLDLSNAYLHDSLKFTRIYARESKIYSGAILETSSGININEYLLDNGCASTSELHPKSYGIRQVSARTFRKGIWAASCAEPVKSYVLYYRSVMYVVSSICVLILSKIMMRYNENYNQKTGKNIDCCCSSR